MPRFIEHFMGAIGRLIGQSRREVVGEEYLGRRPLLVFAKVEGAAAFALDLCDLVVSTEWSRLGLPAELSLRIGLHAGPVYVGRDLITGARNFFGTHVSRAARIEPITPPGQVYASEAFAALAAGRRRRGSGSITPDKRQWRKATAHSRCIMSGALRV